MVVLVPIDDGSDGKGDSATVSAAPATATAPAPGPAPAPMDIGGDGDGSDRGGEDDSAALNPTAGDGGGVDLLSDLPDDVLAIILGQLRDTRNSALTSVLSRRWFNLWTLVDILVLQYDQPHDSRTVREALATHARQAATNIRLLEVISLNSATPDATTSWLRIAAPLVTGELLFRNRSSVPLEILNDEVFSILDQLVEEQEMGAFELPCFTRVTKITLSLGFLGLSLPPSGVFGALRELHLEYVRFNGECTLDDAMLPFLEWLDIRNSSGLASLTLTLAPLTLMTLIDVWGIRWLNAVVPGLKTLCSVRCFCDHVEGVSIFAEELEELRWVDWYSPELINFNDLPRLRKICAQSVFSHELQHAFFNPSCQILLNLYQRIDHVELFVRIEPEQGDDSVTPSMESIIQLPYIRILTLDLETEGHAYGASVLHILTLCTGIAELTLMNQENFEVENACRLNCICCQLTNWRDKDILMKFLEKVEILNFRGEEHELDLLRALLRVAPALRRVRITCHRSFAAWETLSAYVRSFARQVISVEVSQSN